MNLLNISIKDYHSIKEADVSVNGITVLAGPNGSGKSTLSRCVFYFLHEGLVFEERMHDRFRLYLEGCLHILLSVSTPLDSKAFHDALTNFRSLIVGKTPDLDTFDIIYESVIDKLKEALLKVYSLPLRKIILELSALSNIYKKLIEIGVINSTTRWDAKCRAICRFLKQNYFETKEAIARDTAARSPRLLYDCIKETFDDALPHIANIAFAYNGINLLGRQSFIIPHAIREVIYVDSPMADSIPTSYKIWKVFQDAITKPNTSASDEAIIISKLIDKTVGGSVSLKKDALGINDTLVFSDSHGNEFKLESAATGIKTFSYLQRLLDNGMLREGSLLLIDEPEAHLHPQWVVELARIIVFLHKRIGVKVMIASHDPDMVSAIRSIAMKEGIEEVTRFYLSEETEPGKYTFRPCGFDIAPIFRSFNIALDRIETYGAE